MAPVLGEPPFTVGWDVRRPPSPRSAAGSPLPVGDDVFGMPWFPREAAAYAES